MVRNNLLCRSTVYKPKLLISDQANSMDEHIQYRDTLCRLCGTNMPRTRVSATTKESFKSELWIKYRINVDLDIKEIHSAKADAH